eukprot:863540-Rhodomonas_salina.2
MARLKSSCLIIQHTCNLDPACGAGPLPQTLRPPSALPLCPLQSHTLIAPCRRCLTVRSACAGSDWLRLREAAGQGWDETLSVLSAASFKRWTPLPTAGCTCLTRNPLQTLCQT